MTVLLRSSLSEKKESVWREAFKGTRLLKKKTLFFLGIGVVLIVAGTVTHPIVRITAWADSLRVDADEQSLALQSQAGSAYEMVLEVSENGEISVNGVASGDEVTPVGDVDELRYVVFNGDDKKPTQTYIDDLVVYVKLPTEINESLIPENQRRMITAHGVSETLPSSFIDSQTIKFEAVGVSSSANVAILVNFPEGYFTLGTSGETQRTFGNIPGLVWLVISIAIPAIGLIVMLILISRTTGNSLDNPPGFTSNQPPDNLSPAIVGVLAHGKIRPQELLAIIIDLSNRGFLGIEDKDGEMMIYKKNIHNKDLWHNLRPFEVTLLNELFGRKKTLNTASEVSQREARNLFSKRVAKIYNDLYNDVTALGLFSANPALTHWKYRVVGIIIFFAGVGGFIYSVIVAPEPKFTLFFWLACILFSLVIIFFASKISTRTAKGRQELLQWLAFRNYLTASSSVSVSDARANRFEKYLPYAIALDVEYEWASRFSQVDFHLPGWYGAEDDILDVQEFSDSFFPLLGTFTEKMSFMKEPVVE